MNGIGRMLALRMGRAIVTIWLVVSVVFVILRLSGDPVRLLLPSNATTEQVEALRVALGLDRSLPVQYVAFWTNLARGNFGDSLSYHQPSMQIVLARFPATIELALTAFVIASVLGLAIGSMAASWRGSFVDRTVMATMGAVQAAPSFFIGIVLILVFSVHLHWLPTSGQGSPRQLVLPAVTLGALTMASIARISRSALLDVMRADYIRTARAKGLTESVIWQRHTLRNVALPLITVLGLELADLLTGAVIVETVFAWPGVGRLAVDSISSRDYPVVQSVVLLVAAISIGMNVLLDLAYLAIDPRVQHG